MTAPLSLFLERFSAQPVVVIEAVPEVVADTPTEPVVTLTPDELDARIEAARQFGAASSAASHADEIAALEDAHSAATTDALAAARAEWCAVEGERLSAAVDRAMTELRDFVCERTLAVLRPWLAEAATTRARAELGEAFGRLLADAKSPPLRVRGPADVVNAMREAGPAAAVEWQVAETVDVEVIAEATRIETQLAAALADMATES